MPRGAIKAAHEWEAHFRDRYYLEVQRAGREDDDALVGATAALARELGLPIVATHPVQFLRPDDFRAHEARVCISEGYALADPRRPQRFTPEQYFSTQAEMAAAFADVPEALANAVAIAQRCNLALPLGKTTCPSFRRPPASRSTITLGAKPRQGSRAASRRSIPTPTLARRSAPPTTRGSSSRRTPSCRWASPAIS